MDGWTDGWADKWTGGRTGALADKGSEQTSRRAHRRTRAPGGHANRRMSKRGRACWTDEWTRADNGRTGGQANRGERAHEQAIERTSEQG